MADRRDSQRDITTLGVDAAPSLAAMVGSTRALTKPQIARIRARIEELIKQHGSQTAVAKLLGISQQVVGKIHKGDPMGYYVARKLAKVDGVPIQVILDGTPVALESAIRDGGDKWQEPTLAAIRRYAINLPQARADAHDAAFWIRLLDKTESALSPILRDATRL